jgi:hypothetical protein
MCHDGKKIKSCDGKTMLVSRDANLRAVEIVGKVLIAVPTLIALTLLIYANITGNSVGAESLGFALARS